MGVITIKMISSTSITSTMGVTLMLEVTFMFRLAIAIVFKLPLAVYRRTAPRRFRK
jgi:hypothetical protein